MDLLKVETCFVCGFGHRDDRRAFFGEPPYRASKFHYHFGDARPALLRGGYYLMPTICVECVPEDMFAPGTAMIPYNTVKGFFWCLESTPAMYLTAGWGHNAGLVGVASVDMDELVSRYIAFAAMYMRAWHRWCDDSGLVDEQSFADASARRSPVTR